MESKHAFKGLHLYVPPRASIKRHEERTKKTIAMGFLLVELELALMQCARGISHYVSFGTAFISRVTASSSRVLCLQTLPPSDPVCYTVSFRFPPSTPFENTKEKLTNRASNIRNEEKKRL